MAFIKLYFASDDTQVSESPSLTDAVEFTLRADQNEVGDPIRLYAEADEGYSVATTTVQPVGSTAGRWDLAPDEAGSPGTFLALGASLSLGTVGAGSGGRVYFHARARAVDTEDPVNDSTVTLDVEGVASAV